MKILASIFSWVGGALQSFLVYFALSRGVEIIVPDCAYCDTGHIETYYFPFIVFMLAGIGTLIKIAILIWREISVRNGKRIACGVCTILFCSLIGGILTLCLQEKYLDGSKAIEQKIDTRIDRIEANCILLKNHIITFDELENRTQEIIDKTGPLSDEERVRLIIMYKHLFDESYITLDDYNKKKEELGI